MNKCWGHASFLGIKMMGPRKWMVSDTNQHIDGSIGTPPTHCLHRLGTDSYTSGWKIWPWPKIANMFSHEPFNFRKCIPGFELLFPWFNSAQPPKWCQVGKLHEWLLEPFLSLRHTKKYTMVRSHVHFQDTLLFHTVSVYRRYMKIPYTCTTIKGFCPLVYYYIRYIQIP